MRENAASRPGADDDVVERPRQRVGVRAVAGRASGRLAPSALSEENERPAAMPAIRAPRRSIRSLSRSRTIAETASRPRPSTGSPRVLASCIAGAYRSGPCSTSILTDVSGCSKRFQAKMGRPDTAGSTRGRAAGSQPLFLLVLRLDLQHGRGLLQDRGWRVGGVGHDLQHGVAVNGHDQVRRHEQRCPSLHGVCNGQRCMCNGPRCCNGWRCRCNGFRCRCNGWRCTRGPRCNGTCCEQSLDRGH